MLATYAAVLRAGRLEWDDDSPPSLPPTGVRVHVSLLDATDPAPRGPAMAEALAALAAVGGPVGFVGDPAEWQSEIRADRPLPGRSE